MLVFQMIFWLESIDGKVSQICLAIIIIYYNFSIDNISENAVLD